MIATQRNTKIDILRGFAALIVVIGHVLQRFEGCEHSLILNIIVSIQMPIFMMLAGYVRIYSKEITSLKTYGEHIAKRVKTILLPWFAWSAIAYFAFSNKNAFDYICIRAFNMEGAFWFLFSVFTIDLIFSTSMLIGSRFSKNTRHSNILNILIFLFGFGFLLFCLLMIGLKFGITFLAIKYSLYYSIFYLFGYIIAKYELLKKTKPLQTPLLVVALLFYFSVILKYNIMSMPDLPVYIIIRCLAQLCACYIALRAIDNINIKDNIINKSLEKFGGISLELYVVHYFVVKMLSVGNADITTIVGFGLSILYFIIVLSASLIIISFINVFPEMRRVLFGKK